MERFALDNGLKVLIKENQNNDIVAIRLVMKAGIRYESADTYGISNLALRMLLKGTKDWTAEEIAEKLDSIGTELDTGVDKDAGALALQCTSFSLEPSLEILWAILNESNFPKKRVDWERERLLMEIRQDDDSPLAFTMKRLQRNLYGKHPYGNPAKGVPETVALLEKKEIASFYFKHLSPENMVFIAVGNIRKKKMKDWVVGHFGDWTNHKNPCTELDDNSLLPKGKKSFKQTSHKRKVEAENLAIGYFAPSFSTPDFIAMKVLNSILGGSMDSRLFIEVRDKLGLAYSVHSAYSPRLGPSALVVYLGTDPKNHDKALSQCLLEIRKLQEVLVEEPELRRAKEYIKGTYIMAQETNMGQADLYASSEFFGLGYEFVGRYPELIEAVTSEDVQRVAQKYLTNYAMAVTRP